jgi:hypothetical protein
MTDEMTDEQGPIYNIDAPSLKKYRRLAAMDHETRQAYGLAVELAIQAKQRAELQRELPTHNVDCASRTNHNCGRKISAAIRTQHRTGLLAYPSQVRRARSAAVWQTMYDAAMKAKNAAS